MEFNLTPLQHDDYDNILVPWWKQWNWTPPQRDFLPEDGTGGLMVWHGKTPVCAGFVYNTNSKVGWVDWIISNKEYINPMLRQEALELLILTLGEVCKKQDNKYNYALLRHKKLIKTYERLGYKAGDQYTQEMIKINL
tara:strand:- start:130 stop:543 length:414 start_codon:yes stop_codon:yes gene_type:complete